MEEEVKSLFKLAYYPIMYANQRLNGGDFLSVAIPLMDAMKERTSDEIVLKKAARIIVLEFNDLLSPKMSVQEIDNLIQLVYKPGTMTRAVAKQISDEFIRTHSSSQSLQK